MAVLGATVVLAIYIVRLSDGPSDAWRWSKVHWDRRVLSDRFEARGTSMTQVLVRVCLICSQPMAPYQPTVYLDSGAVVHVPCRRAFRGAATTSVAVIRPTSQAMQLRARERRTADALLPTGTARLVHSEP
jgi:hypothetical protein